MRNRLRTAIVLLVLVDVARADAQENTKSFTQWINRRLEMVTTAALGASTPGKQVETPSIADNSTALVDKAAGPDLIGIALQFFNLGNDNEGAPASVTVSAFTLRTAVLGLDPNRPEVYAEGRNWRRVSVSAGREGADVTTGVPEAQLIGVKVLAWDGRDLTRPDNVRALQEELAQQTVTMAMAQALQNLQTEVSRRLSPRFNEPDPDKFARDRLGAAQHADTLAQLTDADLAAIDAILLEQVAPLVRAQRDDVARSIKALQQAPQLSFSYQAKLRDSEANGADEHAWQGIFDYGVASRLNVSVNAAVSRISRPLMDATFGGRVAFEAQFLLSGGGSTLAELVRLSAPLTLSTSYAGEWDDIDEDTHKFQAKLTIPLAALLKGLSLPVSVTVASRRELIDEAEVRGQVGFTIDFSKFQQALRSAAR